MDLRLRDHLAKLFNEQKKSKKDVRGNHRAMSKLLKEAQRLKTVLSANVDFMAQVSIGTTLSSCCLCCSVQFWVKTKVLIKIRTLFITKGSSVLLGHSGISRVP